MENMLVTVGRTEIAFKNKKLQNATMHIFSLGENIRKKWFEIGAIMSIVDTQELYKDDGFASVHEWASDTFKLKKSRIYDLLKIGREYTREVTSKSGSVVGYECNLLPESSADNFNVTQVTRLLPVGHDVAVEMVNNGEIRPDMTVKEISNIVKSRIGNTSEEESTEEAEPETTPTTVDTREAELRAMFDNVSTAELIAEIKLRGFSVLNDVGEKM